MSMAKKEEKEETEENERMVGTQERAGADDNGPLCYEVAVPLNCGEGDSFSVILNSQEFFVKVPHGVEQGSKILVSVDREDVGSMREFYVGGMVPRRHFYVHESSYLAPRREEPRASSIFAASCVFIEVVVAGLLFGAYGSYWGTLKFPESCEAENYLTGAPLTTLYFNLLRGVGSSNECTNDGSDFCIRWTNMNAWGAIDSLTHSSMEQDARYNWNSALVIIPLASGFVLLAAMLHLSIFACERDDRGNELSMSLLIVGGFFLWLAWVLALSGLNSVVYTTTMDPQYWLRLLRTGVSFQDILAGDNAPLDVNTTTCSVSLEYNPGASLCSTAVAISFFVGLFLLITCCCGACFEEMPGHDYSYGAYGSGGRDVVHIVPARHRVAHPVHVPGIQGADEESKDMDAAALSAADEEAQAAGPKLARAVPVSAVVA